MYAILFSVAVLVQSKQERYLTVGVAEQLATDLDLVQQIREKGRKQS